MHNCGNMYEMRKDVFRNLCKANIFKILKNCWDYWTKYQLIS